MSCRVRTLCMLWFLLSPATVHAASPYELSRNQEWLYFGASAALGVTGVVADRGRDAPTPAELHMLDRGDVPAFDRFAAGNWNTSAQTLSDVFLLTGVMSPLAIMNRERTDYAVIAIMYLETLALTSSGVMLTKGAVTRYRPFAYGEKAPLDERLDPDAQRSFLSGHAALASSGLVFTATLFSHYYPESRARYGVWSVSIAGAAATAWLRIEGGKHFPSDVLTGMAWGGLIGYAVPAAHRRNSSFRLLPLLDERRAAIVFVTRFP